MMQKKRAQPKRRPRSRVIRNWQQLRPHLKVAGTVATAEQNSSDRATILMMSCCLRSMPWRANGEIEKLSIKPSKTPVYIKLEHRYNHMQRQK